MPEYLYGETLRWSFGFENPNKGAVLFVCLLPLCWLAWNGSWGVRALILRIPAILLAGVLVTGAGGALFMTFSRGGVVAALVAMGYLWSQSYQGFRGGGGKPKDGEKPESTDCKLRHKFFDTHGTLRKAGYLPASAMLVLLLVALGIWTGLAERSTAGAIGDASITHRGDLWRGALEMAYDNPVGWGDGHSGMQYMQWYQPTEKREGYRTMVSSYLTFLVERGWLMFGLCTGVLIFFWCWSAPNREKPERYDEVKTALRASILGFLVAGIFSTTMEDGRLWFFPLLCTGGLVVLTMKGSDCYRFSRWRKDLGVAMTLTLVLLVSMWTLGRSTAMHDPMIRSCGIVHGTHGVLSVTPRGANSVMRLLPDAIVLGDQYGKLARALAFAANAKVTLGDSEPCDRVIATGARCLESGLLIQKHQLWIAPPIPTQDQLVAIKASSQPMQVLIPGIDEDGRSSWWRAHAPVQAQIITLDGVGNRVDWAWERILEVVKK